MDISPSILLVEDDEDDYVLAREKLQVSFGTDVRLDWVSTWDEGLASVGDASHDIYLIDFRLGARTGLELVRAACQKGCSKPLILLTGEDNFDIDREAMEAGAADYLIKGQITADQLARAIRYAIRQKSTEEALRHNEARYRELFDDSPVAIWEEDWSSIKQMLDELALGGVKDWRGYFDSHRDQLGTAYDLAKTIEISQAAVDLYRTGSKEDLVRTTTAALVIDEKLDAFGEMVLSFLAGQMTVDIEAKNMAGDGSEIMVRRRVVIPPRYRDDWSRVISAVEDITQRKLAEDSLLESEEALQERIADLEEAQSKLEIQGQSLVRLADDLLIARDEARAADRAKSEFLAAMSHELRTPMNAVLGFSEIIKDETLGSVGITQYRDYAEDIHESGKHLLGLINDILDLSKIESGTDDLHEDEIEIHQIVGSALKLVGQRAEQGAIKLHLEIAEQLPTLRADERKLKQILVNLLSNAVKFSDDGSEVALWAWCRTGSGHVFQIIDTGIGIAPEDIPKALSRFGQVDGDLNRQYEGTGLGLPLTKALVEQHGGTLDLQSQVGVGTTVTVRFPAERIADSPHNAKAVDAADRKAG